MDLRVVLTHGALSLQFRVAAHSTHDRVRRNNRVVNSRSVHYRDKKIVGRRREVQQERRKQPSPKSAAVVAPPPPADVARAVDCVQKGWQTSVDEPWVAPDDEWIRMEHLGMDPAPHCGGQESRHITDGSK